MLKRLALAAALLASAPAFAANTITITIVSDVPGNVDPLSGTMTLSQSDMSVFLAALQAQTGTTSASAATLAWLSVLKSEVQSIALAYQNAQALGGVTPISPN